MYPEVVLSRKVDGHEGEPQDTCTVHGESDVSRFVEVLGNLSRFERVDGTSYNEEQIVG